MPQRVFRLGVSTAIVLLGALTLTRVDTSVSSVSLYPIALGRSGVVSSAELLASRAGLRILMQGGNAFDAAIATAAALGVVEFRTSGLATDGYWLLYDAKKKEVTAIDFAGIAPSGAKPERFPLKPGQDITLAIVEPVGYLSSTVPGGPASWQLLLKRYGSMKLETVLQPAIEYAENGFPISTRGAESIANVRASFLEFPTTAATYLIDGRAPYPGEVFFNKNLARTYRRLATGGVAEFYTGSIAKDIVSFYQQHGGLFTLDDFAQMDKVARWVQPISTTYRGYTVYTQPPTASGTDILQELNILEGFDLKALTHNSADYIHVFAEAIKLTTADRLKYHGDSDFVKVPVQQLISKEYAARARAKIDMAKAMPLAVSNLTTSDLTNSMSVIDKDGNMVIGTFTIQAGMGCRVVPGNLGFLMNNSLSYFSLDPLSPNVVAPRKRPEWPMANVIVMQDNKPLLVLGAPGGHGITQTVPQTLLNIIEFGMDVQAAIEAPRFRLMPEYRSYPDKGVSMVIRPEARIPSAVMQALEARGHTIEPYEDWGGGVGSMSAILIHPKSGVYMGGADPRGSYAALAW